MDDRELDQLLDVDYRLGRLERERAHGDLLALLVILGLALLFWKGALKFDLGALRA